MNGPSWETRKSSSDVQFLKILFFSRRFHDLRSSCENSRPCALFAGGHCKHGADCSFCHMSHEQRLPKLDKQQRTKLKMLSVAQLLSIILEPLKMKVWQQGIQNEAAEIIEIMELEVAKYPQVQELDTGRVTTQRFRPKKHVSLGFFFKNNPQRTVW